MAPAVAPPRRRPARGVRDDVRAFDTAADVQRVRVGELDINVLLVHAGKLTVELKGILKLANVELGLERGRWLFWPRAPMGDPPE